MYGELKIDNSLYVVSIAEQVENKHSVPHSYSNKQHSVGKPGTLKSTSKAFDGL